MIKITMKFKGPSGNEIRRMIETATKEKLRKKGFPNLHVKAQKKTGSSYDLSVDGISDSDVEKVKRAIKDLV
jgi:hypothetical protein